jgi:hydrogenase maturation protease
MTMPCPVRIIGAGSPQGDDAVGWEVVRRLRKIGMERDGVQLHVAEGGQRFLDWLDGQGSLVLVDAVAGAQPGTVHRFEWPNLRLQTPRPGSTHGWGPAEALELAAVLGVLPPHVIIFGVEAATWGPGQGLSTPVEAAIPGLLERIRAEVGRA